MKRQMQEEIARMRRDYGQWRRAEGGEQEASGRQLINRSVDGLQGECEFLTERHTRMLNEFLHAIEMAETLQRMLEAQRGELRAAQQAQAADIAEVQELRAVLTAAETRIREAKAARRIAEAVNRQAMNAQVAAETARDEAETAKRTAETALTRNQLRDRRHANFGENDYHVDVTLKIIKEFDGND